MAQKTARITIISRECGGETQIEIAKGGVWNPQTSFSFVSEAGGSGDAEVKISHLSVSRNAIRIVRNKGDGTYFKLEVDVLADGDKVDFKTHKQPGGVIQVSSSRGSWVHDDQKGSPYPFVLDV